MENPMLSIISKHTLNNNYNYVEERRTANDSIQESGSS